MKRPDSVTAVSKTAWAKLILHHATVIHASQERRVEGAPTFFYRIASEHPENPLFAIDFFDLN